MSEQTYLFNVVMTCGGCSGAVTRALTKAQNDGAVTKFAVSLEKQEVAVRSKESLETVQAKIAKTGKAVNSSSTSGDDVWTKFKPEEIKGTA